MNNQNISSLITELKKFAASLTELDENTPGFGNEDWSRSVVQVNGCLANITSAGSDKAALRAAGADTSRVLSEIKRSLGIWGMYPFAGMGEESAGIARDACYAQSIKAVSALGQVLLDLYLSTETAVVA